jgi:signal transduction histidine kinase
MIVDQESLATAIRCLLDNAVKYSPGSEEIWLEAATAGDGLRISVRDAGIGIAPDEQERVLERFYRSGPLVAKVKGAGLGLTLADEIVAAHGGRITLDSRPGGGTTVTIHLNRTAHPGGVA